MDKEVEGPFVGASLDQNLTTSSVFLSYERSANQMQPSKETTKTLSDRKVKRNVIIATSIVLT